MRTTFSLLLLLTLTLTACTDKWQRVETAFNVGAPCVISRFEQSGKLTPDEATAIREAIPSIVVAVKTKSFDGVVIPLGNLAKLSIKNLEAKQWLDDLLAVTQVILGVEIPTGNQVPQMKSLPQQRAPNLSDENLRKLEDLTK